MPHCIKYKQRLDHPNTPESKCFLNKEYKGYHRKLKYEDMEMDFNPKHKLPADLGGYKDKSDDSASN